MTEFLVIGLTAAIIIALLTSRCGYISAAISGQRNNPGAESATEPLGKEAIVTSLLLMLWAPVLAMGILDFPIWQRWRALFMLSPVTFLFFAPFICLWPRYRENGWKRSWRVILFPIAICLVLLAALRRRNQTGRRC